MISSASQLRQKGANDLSGRWGEAALLTFVSFVVASIFSGTVTAGGDIFVPGLGTVLSVLLIPMGWGVCVAFLDNHRRTTNDPFHIGCLIDGYRDFVRIFLTLLLSSVYTLLWALLLIVPGIIKALSYAMTPFILRDHPELQYNAAIEKSMDRMVYPVLLHPLHRLLLAATIRQQHIGKLLRRGESRIRRPCLRKTCRRKRIV